jgi:hypothetical protein
MKITCKDRKHGGKNVAVTPSYQSMLGRGEKN